MPPRRLTPQQKEFLDLVSRAAFANPFSEERMHLDLAIAGLPRTATSADRLAAAVANVSRFLDNLRPWSERPAAVAERDRLDIAHLFVVFHRFVEAFDALIRKQVEIGSGVCPVPFAGQALEELAARGFSHAEAVQHFGMFYQLRRAFFFIQCSLVGRSACMRQLREALWNNVFTRDVLLYSRHLRGRMDDFSTLLLGETGTGKGASATAVGRSAYIPYNVKQSAFAESFMGSFIAINLSQFSESLIESELFGHRKGAFTGAVEAHEGVFSRCSRHGAIFLDEIGDVSPPVQIKLLKVLEERTFSPVGSHEARRFEGRIIAASNCSLDELRGGRRFREDFYYRLCSDVITVPPLRQRIREEPRELDILVNLILRRILGYEAPELVDDILDRLHAGVGADYPWPGNVRELEQGVRRILLTQAYAGAAGPQDGDLAARVAADIDRGACTAQELLNAYCRLLHDRYGTYEEVARRTRLDRRTVKKYIEESS